MKVALIAVPFDSGHLHERMGRGPACLLDRGLADCLSAEGFEVGVRFVEPETDFPTEIGTAFELHGLIGAAVEAARSAAAFPIILSGNCNVAAIGALAGMGADRPSLIWFDGHADFTTPETAETGFFDGMGLAMATGRCWRPMTRSVPGFRPVADGRTMLIGAHDIEEAEGAELRRSGITHLSPQALREPDELLAARLAALAPESDGTYLHIDLDVCNPKFARANHLAPEGGLTPDELLASAGAVVKSLPVRVLGVTAYDPSCDPQGRMSEVATRLIESLLLAQQSRHAG